MEPFQLPEKIERLLNLLDDVEKCIHDDPSSVKNDVGRHLAKRLHEVAVLVDRKCNTVEILDESDGEGSREHENLPEMQSRIKKESRAPTPPIVTPKHEITPSSLQQSSSLQQPSLQQSSLQQSSLQQQQQQPFLQQQSSAQQSSQQPVPAVPSMYRRFSNQQPEVLDEPAKKRRREAEAMVKKMQRPKTFACGISYQGDENERNFSEGFKDDVRKHLPALRTHQHLFHYMAWATTERLECSHCRLCPNTFK